MQIKHSVFNCLAILALLAGLNACQPTPTATVSPSGLEEQPSPTASPPPTATSTLTPTPKPTPMPVPKSSYEASITSLYISTNGTKGVGYADFNRDGREDLLMSYVSGTTETVPIKMFLQDADGKFIEDDSLLPSPVPGTVFARKVLIADFNRDNTPDIFIADHGYDYPPFPGAAPLLLMSTEGKFKVMEIPGVPVGFQHSATAADITGDGAPDIFVSDTTNGAFLLINDGAGNFTFTREGIPSIKGAYYNSEFIDLDDDGFYDLLVGGHEIDVGVKYPTYIFWGDASGTFNAERATSIPGDNDYQIVLDFDAEDIDGDGIRELVLTRSKYDPFYEGYYFQILKIDNRQFTEISTQIVPDKSTWEGSTAEFVPWIELRDFNGDGSRDLIVLDKIRNLIYLNDGQGNFSRFIPAPAPTLNATQWEESHIIYADSMAGGWSLDPWGGQVDISSFVVIYNGERAMEVTLQPGQGITFDALQAFDISDYEYLVFFLNGGMNANQQLYVEMKSTENVPLGEKVNLAYYIEGYPLQPGQWHKVTIPLRVLNPDKRPFGWFDIGDASGTGASTFYVDDIRFVAARP